jgi:ferredoxin
MRLWARAVKNRYSLLKSFIRLFDAFFAPVSARDYGLGLLRWSVREAITLPAPLAPAPALPAAELHFTRSGLIVQWQAGSSLLSSVDASGVSWPRACRRGLCGSCRATLKKGVVRNLRTGEMQYPKSRGTPISLCITEAVSPQVYMDI